MQQIQDENDEPNPDLAQACLMTGFFIQLKKTNYKIELVFVS